MLPDGLAAIVARAAVINAGGPYTAFGGSVPSERVIEAMAYAQRSYMDVHELNRAAGEDLAARLGVPACLITSGAMSGVVLATAAVVTKGRGPLLRSQALRESRPRDIAIQLHRIGDYANAFELGGGRLVAIGTSETCTPDDLEVALEMGAVAVGFLEHRGRPSFGLTLDECAATTAATGIPVIVDAAAAAPPMSAIRALHQSGGSLVSVSGGKGLGGPQHSGLLLGDAELVECARACAAPNLGLGRPAKVTRDAIVGVHVATLDALERDEDEWRSEIEERADHIATTIRAGTRKVAVEVYLDDEFGCAVVAVRPRRPEHAAALARVRNSLLEATPRIFVRYRRQTGNLLVLPMSLTDSEAELVADRLLSAVVAVDLEDSHNPNVPGDHD